jgi:uncharacterized membrane protein
MSEISRNSVDIEAPFSEVLAVLSDLESYPGWSTAIKSVEAEVKEDAGLVTKAKMSIEAGVLRDRVTLDYDWSKLPNEITFSLDDADLLTEMTGAYKLNDNGDDTTTVTYELTVALSMPVPAMMRQKAERSTIDLVLSQLKAKLEG